MATGEGIEASLIFPTSIKQERFEPDQRDYDAIDQQN
jgi:hypothetical protein